MGSNEDVCHLGEKGGECREESIGAGDGIGPTG